MKLQNFIENYQKARKNHIYQNPSPEKSYIFKTSQSIGTLNSKDQFATDRSFAIKEIYPNNHQLSAKRMNTQNHLEYQHNCSQTQRNHIKIDIPFAKIKEMKNSNSQKHTLKPSTTPKIHKDVSNPSNYNRKSISYQHESSNIECLYEQQPSAIFQSKSLKSTILNLINDEENDFMILFEQLLSRVQHLEQENLLIQQQWLDQQKMALKFDRNCEELQDQIQRIRDRVTTVIQKNIQTENMIKQILLKQEMEKYSIWPHEPAKRQVLGIKPFKNTPMNYNFISN